VNDRFDVALATGAGGVHVGREDLPPEEIRKIGGPDVVVGVSAHDRKELLEAQASGATYAGLGAFYASRTKPEANVIDVEGAEIRDPLPGLAIPVLAIGGITAERVGNVLRIPAVTGVAVSAAIQRSDDPAAAVGRLRSALVQAWRDR
jgi:thiamine-phosphate pyrophosphorylase